MLQATTPSLRSLLRRAWECDHVARPVPEALRASPERSSGSQSETGWAHTGHRFQTSARGEIFKKHIRGLTVQPIGVGFGISQPEQARQVGGWRADAVIVGSAFVKRLAIIHTPTRTQSHLLNFVKVSSSHDYNLNISLIT